MYIKLIIYFPFVSFRILSPSTFSLRFMSYPIPTTQTPYDSFDRTRFGTETQLLKSKHLPHFITI